MGRKKAAKKRQAAAERKRYRLSQPEAGDNPFSLRVTRTKHDVLGQQQKGRVGKRGQSREQGVKLRERTLLVEHKQKHKSNTFRDKRIGEYDADMSEEDKMLMRFAQERQKRHEKSSLFNLEADMGPEETLTHGGKNLGQILDDYVPDMMDMAYHEDEDILGKQNVGENHFGGFKRVFRRRDANGELLEPEREEERRKTHREIMDEVVAKAKMHKMERQRTLQKNEDMVEQLDADFIDADFQRLLHSSSLRVARELKERPKKKADSYDISVRELAYDYNKARATDRLKTPEEIAREQLETLQRLEDERLARMQDPDTATRNKNMSVEYLGDKGKDPRAGRGTLELVTGEDGEMTLVDHSKPNGKAEDDSSEDSDSDSDSDSNDDDDDDDDSSEEVSEDSEEAEPSSAAPKAKDNDKRKRRRVDPPSTLPFVVPCPGSYEEFTELLNGHSTEDQLTLIERIITCTNVKLLAENRAKMTTFFDILLKHTTSCLKPATADLKLAQQLSGHLYSIVQQLPVACATRFQSEFKRIERKLRKGLKQRLCPFPPLHELVLFRLAPQLFPASDFKHPVMTPCLLLASQMLTYCAILTPTDVQAGLFLVTVCLECAQEASRFAPEALLFLAGILSLGSTCPRTAPVPPSFLNLTNKAQQMLIKGKSTPPKKVQPLKISGLLQESLDCTEQWKANALSSTANLLLEFMSLYSSHEAFSQMFEPAVVYAEAASQVASKPAAQALDKLVSAVKRMSSRVTLQALQLQTHKPVPLQQLEPDFEPEYHERKRLSEKDRDAKELKKLKYLHKKETKGAIRELRKDNRFLAKEKLQEQLGRDAERFQKVKQIQNLLTSQHQEDRARDRLKEKLKKK